MTMRQSRPGLAGSRCLRKNSTTWSVRYDPLGADLRGEETEFALVSASAETDEHVIQALLDDCTALEQRL